MPEYVSLFLQNFPMKFVRKVKDLQEHLKSARRKSRVIGLVPTMGALHQGHLSLVDAARNDCDTIVVSIFVNPTQFNDPKDLERYPRNMEGDLELLKQYPVDFVFAPSVQEMYPEKVKKIFDLSPLDTVMEGKHRPGHFNGVAQIVSKLFESVRPDKAYFGEKDFQQLAIIRKLVAMLQMNIEIIGCPIVREEDGLAMSSRNQLLTKEERAAAPLINKALLEAVIEKQYHSPAEIRSRVTAKLNAHPLMKVDYFEIVDAHTLMPVSSWDESGKIIACIAVQLVKVRLIDNRYFV
jgi:pantoate--beta-alanine ligase